GSASSEADSFSDDSPRWLDQQEHTAEVEFELVVKHTFLEFIAAQGQKIRRCRSLPALGLQGGGDPGVHESCRTSLPSAG
ncbi:unnamed protein product, partial [Symbiodinium microadriaticum]